MVMKYPSSEKNTKQTMHLISRRKSAWIIDVVELCSGTHNEKSCELLVELMQKKNIPVNDKRDMVRTTLWNERPYQL
jgi:hypothetical protein